MNLLELCEPLFLYVCRLNRSARSGHELSGVRGELQDLLQKLRSQSANDARLTQQYEKIEPILVYFIDFVIIDSSLSFAAGWEPLAVEFWNERTGDEKFFELMDENLAQSSEDSTERLTIFYVCLGLGFTGVYTGQPDVIRKKMLQCSARIRKYLDSDEMAKICPEAYENVDTRNLVQPPGKTLLGIGIALVGLILVLFVVNYSLFKTSINELDHALKTIIEQGSRLP